MASILFAKRISAKTAKETYLCFEHEELTSSEAILDAGWDRLVKVLDSGGYTRYDFSTATRLLGIAKTLKGKYGSLDKLHEISMDSSDLESRLQEFVGVGPVCVNIFFERTERNLGKSRTKSFAYGCPDCTKNRPRSERR